MSRPFAAVERLFERFLERPAARLFHARVQPAQIERRLERAMESGRTGSGERTFVPHRYRAFLHPDDLAALEPLHGQIESDLADGLLARARSRGYRLVARPEILLLPSVRVGEGDVDVSADPLDPGLVRSAAAGLRPVELEGPKPPRPPIPGTAPVPVLYPPADGVSAPVPATAAGVQADGSGGEPPPPAPPPAEMQLHALIEVRPGGAASWSIAFRGGSVRVGRSTDNEVVLLDERVSRSHGRFTSRQGTLVYTDLGSTNGSFVNGARVREIALGAGDIVRVGNTSLVIRPYP